jgi:hypothetical protein
MSRPLNVLGKPIPRVFDLGNNGYNYCRASEQYNGVIVLDAVLQAPAIEGDTLLDVFQKGDKYKIVKLIGSHHDYGSQGVSLQRIQIEKINCLPIKY